jgi:hypothetical protein
MCEGGKSSMFTVAMLEHFPIGKIFTREFSNERIWNEKGRRENL